MEWRCQLASLRQATRLAGECPDPQQIGRESLDGEEWEPPELLDGDGGDGDGLSGGAKAGGPQHLPPPPPHLPALPHNTKILNPSNTPYFKA